MTPTYPAMDDFSNPDEECLEPPKTSGHVIVLRQIFNPLRVARTLIQLGYEPLPPKPYFNSLCLPGLPKRTYFFPNAFIYARYLIRENGFWNLMTCGFAARLFLDVLAEACQFMNRRFVVEYYPNETRQLRDAEADAEDDDDEGMGAPMRKTALQEALVDNIMEEIPLFNFTMHLGELFFLKTYEVLLTQPFYGSCSLLSFSSSS